MIYPKNPYCPLNNDCSYPGMDNENNGNNGGNTGNGNGMGSDMTCEQMLTKICEMEFTLTDLNLYLDTHPDNKEALDMFTKLSASLKSMMYDYNQKCKALCVNDVPNTLPFQWSSNKWPWQA